MQATTETIDLDTPIQRGEQRIAQVTLTKPNAGALRGCSLMDLMRMDVAALMTLLPRITQPTLTAQDVSNLDPADLTQFATAVSGFLLPKAVRAEAFPDASKTPPPTLQ